MIRRLLNRVTHRLHELPVIVLMPHSRCNCRCVMCDIWKANQDKRELSAEDLAPHLEDFRRLGVRHVALSGGEALMHRNLWTLCDQFKQLGIHVSLLSTGLLLKAHATEIITHTDEVIVSLDGDREMHNTIRNIPEAYEKMAAGIAHLLGLNPRFKVTGRCVLQQQNAHLFTEIVAAARQLQLQQISFLAADVSSTAFNRQTPWDETRAASVALTLAQAQQLADQITAHEKMHPEDFSSRFIAESPARLQRFVQYYRALHGAGPLVAPPCDAPWVSAVVESNGDILPCYFHPPYGNLRDGFSAVINSAGAIAFRKSLDVKRNAVCQRCVCSLKLGFATP